MMGLPCAALPRLKGCRELSRHHSPTVSAVSAAVPCTPGRYVHTSCLHVMPAPTAVAEAPHHALSMTEATLCPYGGQQLTLNPYRTTGTLSCTTGRVVLCGTPTHGRQVQTGDCPCLSLRGTLPSLPVAASAAAECKQHMHWLQPCMTGLSLSLPHLLPWCRAERNMGVRCVWGPHRSLGLPRQATKRRL